MALFLRLSDVSKLDFCDGCDKMSDHSSPEGLQIIISIMMIFILINIKNIDKERRNDFENLNFS
jgi:hypothetical protein